MEFEIPETLEKTREYLVEAKHAADFLGSGKVEVLSTPSMILMMEQTALLAVQDYLPEGWITVGILVNIRHLKATPKGETVRIVAKLKERDRRRLVFDVAAFHGDEKIGEGTHERFVVNKEKFMASIKKN